MNNVKIQQHFLWQNYMWLPLFKVISELTIRFSLCNQILVGWSYLGFVAASVTVQYIINHPKASYNSIKSSFFCWVALKKRILIIPFHLIEEAELCKKWDLWKTPLLARFLCPRWIGIYTTFWQAQILIFAILNEFMWLIPTRRDRLPWTRTKMNIFQRSQSRVKA